MKKYLKILMVVFMLSIPTVSLADTCQAGNCVDGQGSLVTNEGYVLEGLFINSQIVSGSITLSNGMKYEGTIYIDGFPVEGTITIPGGNKYTGEIAHLVPNGQGTMTYSDGDMESYTGSWKAGKQSGQGTMTYSDGTTYKGGWKDGVRHGKGIEVDANGTGKVHVVYKNGIKIH